MCNIVLFSIYVTYYFIILPCDDHVYVYCSITKFTDLGLSAYLCARIFVLVLTESKPNPGIDEIVESVCPVTTSTRLVNESWAFQLLLTK